MASTVPGATVPGRSLPVDGNGSEGARSGPSPAIRIALMVVGVIALVLALFYGIKFLIYASAHETTDDAMIDADVVQVTSKIAERVDRIYVDTNQSVKKGQLLVQLDDSTEKDAYNQAQAAVSAQQAQAEAAEQNVALTRETQSAQNLQNTGSIDQAKAGIAGADAQALSADQQIAVEQAGVDAARAQLKASQDAVPGALQNLRKASADLRRTQSLVSTGDLASSQLDADRAGYEAARSMYSQAQADVGAALANLAQAQQKLSAQRFSTQSTQTQIGSQQGQLTTAQGKLAESGAPSRSTGTSGRRTSRPVKPYPQASH
jgi:membrane fusion protein (multidrug efflux system)